MKRLNVKDCDMYISTKMIVINCNEKGYEMIKEFVDSLCRELDADMTLREFDKIETSEGTRYELECFFYQRVK